jgi:hypothetical protein
MLLRVVALLFSRGDPVRGGGLAGLPPADRAHRYEPIDEQRAHLRLIPNWFA